MTSPRRRKFKFIGCNIIYREACWLAATCPHVVDVEFMPKGLHNLETPDMVARLQAAVDAVPAEAGYEAVLLGYARCNDGLVGIEARELPLVLPRAHDCITLLFGSRDRYDEYFNAFPGTYYMSTGWAERDDEMDHESLQAGLRTVDQKLGLHVSYEELAKKYGEENAKYVMQTLGDTRSNYSKYLYIRMGVAEEDDYVERTRADAEKRQWKFELREGDLRLLRKLFRGDWDDDFVVAQPGQKVVARNDERVLGAE